MALCSQQLQRFLLNKIYIDYSHNKSLVKRPKTTVKSSRLVKRFCSAIAIDAPSSVAGVSGIRWGSVKLKGARDEMEDDIVIVRLDDHDGFCFAVVFDGHAGFSSVEFLREELYRECVTSLQGGKLLKSKDSKAIKKALQDAFENTDAKLLNWLETREKDESGSTVTAVFLKDDVMFISHVGDSSVVMSCSGKAEVLTESHRPYGNKKASLQEIKRIREAGGWIVNGRICGDISVSRAFGDIRFKTKKNEMLKEGVDKGLWSQKFASRIEFRGDLITATPDVSQVAIGSDAEFIVLASDGLWDYINSSEAVSFVRSHLRQYGDVQMASEALAQLALNRRSQDNISVAIADLGRTDWRNLPVERQNVAYELAQALATVALVSAGIWVSTLLSS